MNFRYGYRTFSNAKMVTPACVTPFARIPYLFRGNGFWFSCQGYLYRKQPARMIFSGKMFLMNTYLSMQAAAEKALPPCNRRWAWLLTFGAMSSAGYVCRKLAAYPYVLFLFYASNLVKNPHCLWARVGRSVLAANTDTGRKAAEVFLPLLSFRYEWGFSSFVNELSLWKRIFSNAKMITPPFFPAFRAKTGTCSLW